MKQTKSLYDIINGVQKPTRVKRKKLRLRPVPIGHHLAIRIYKEGIYLDTLFVDNIDICRSYTMIHYNPRLMEEYPVRHENITVSINSAWVMYENGTEFEIIRIS